MIRRAEHFLNHFTCGQPFSPIPAHPASRRVGLGRLRSWVGPAMGQIRGGETKALAIYVRSATTYFLHDVLNTVKDENREEVPSRQPTLRKAPGTHMEAGSA